jgi:hypothetical protein
MLVGAGQLGPKRGQGLTAFATEVQSTGSNGTSLVNDIMVKTQREIATPVLWRADAIFMRRSVTVVGVLD